MQHVQSLFAPGLFFCLEFARMIVYPTGDVPLHPDFRRPSAPPGALWSVFACSAPHFANCISPVAGQCHPRFQPVRHCAACNYPEAKCVGGGMGLIEKNWEVYEYACPACGKFTVYLYFE
jgi:hypothetical protein